MNNWIDFPLYAGFAIACWAVALLGQFIKNQRTAQAIFSGFTVLGIIAIVTFTANLWMHLDRPPMRTLGETRLWYAVFLPIIGLIMFRVWKYKWLLSYSLVMAMVFITINYFNPETYNKALMPALQSVWFVPHVLVYIFSYAILAASSIVAALGIYKWYRQTYSATILKMADNLVYIGFGFLSLGLLFGALWAKEAWGHYWTWDPKETWAMLTWLGYLIYIHIRYRNPDAVKTPLYCLSLAFVILLLCWFGVNYMPSASQSVHTYSNG